MEKKSNKWVVIALCTVIIVLIGAITYLFVSGAATLNIKNNKENKTEEKEQNKEHNKDEKKDIKTISMTETEKNYFMNNMLLVYDGDKNVSTEYNSSTLSNQEKMWFAIKNAEYGDIMTGFSLSTLMDASKKYLGEAGIFNPEDVICKTDDEVILHYNEERQLFERVGVHGHEGEGFVYIVNSFVEGTITSKDNEPQIATIKVRKSFSKLCPDLCGPDMNYTRFGKIKDSLDEKNQVVDFSKELQEIPYEQHDEYYKKHIEENPEKYPIHTYTFKYDNGNYYLESIVIEK